MHALDTEEKQADTESSDRSILRKIVETRMRNHASGAVAHALGIIRIHAGQPVRYLDSTSLWYADYNMLSYSGITITETSTTNQLQEALRPQSKCLSILWRNSNE
jgi:hypothetical protein